MSSWANRNILRKRNINQIPEPFRPQIISRAEQSEVIISESFQYRNEIIISESKSQDNKIVKKSDYSNLQELILRKIDSIPNTSSTTELKYKGKNYVFVILRNIRNIKDNDLWISSYNSIRKYYTNKIVIIDDNSSINTVNGKLFNTEVIYSDFPGAGEVLPYYYFIKYNWADYMIFLHDSMFINRPFTDQELEGDAKFHWYFESNGFDDINKIHRYFALINNGNELTTFIDNNKWIGCFGSATIISRELIQYIEEKYNIFTQLCHVIKKRKDREAFERILGIVLLYEEAVNISSCSNFGDINKFPDAFNSENDTFENVNYIIQSKNYNTAIIKIWRGR